MSGRSETQGNISAVPALFRTCSYSYFVHTLHFGCVDVFVQREAYLTQWERLEASLASVVSLPKTRRYLLQSPW